MVIISIINDKLIVDVNNNKNSINKIMLRYKNMDKVDYRDVAYEEDFKNTNISEYTIRETGLIYTSKQIFSHILYLTEKKNN